MIYVRLNELLKERGIEMSLRELAENIGENRERVRRFASNKMDNVLPVDLIDKLCIYFDCNVDDLFVHRADEPTDSVNKAETDS